MTRTLALPLHQSSVCQEVFSPPNPEEDPMLVRYTLTMEDLKVHGEQIDSVTMDWEDEASREEVMGLSQKWITSKNFLTSRMNGLSEVGESSLTIEPIEEPAPL